MFVLLTLLLPGFAHSYLFSRTYAISAPIAYHKSVGTHQRLHMHIFGSKHIELLPSEEKKSLTNYLKRLANPKWFPLKLMIFCSLFQIHTMFLMSNKIMLPFLGSELPLDNLFGFILFTAVVSYYYLNGKAAELFSPSSVPWRRPRQHPFTTLSVLFAVYVSYIIATSFSNNYLPMLLDIAVKYISSNIVFCELHDYLSIGKLFPTYCPPSRGFVYFFGSLTLGHSIFISVKIY